MEGHVVLTAEKIGQIGQFPITNTLLVSWVVVIVLTIASFIATRRIREPSLRVSLVPSGIQNFFEMIVEFGYTTVDELAHEKSKIIFPIVMTFFLFIITANWMGLLPGFGTFGLKQVHDGKEVIVPLFRSINSDLNMTLALALISAAATHILSIKYLGIWDYLKRWISLNPIFLFVGLLEVVSEFTKIVSLSFRLFGNIFAGEVVLVTVSTLSKWTAFLIPLPFLFLEIIVGFVQAAVFMMLTLVFMILLTEKHGEEH